MRLQQLAAAGREPALPLDIQLAGQSLQLQGWLRVLPGRRYVGVGVWQGRRVFAKLLVGAGAERHFQRERDGARLLAEQGLETPQLLAEGHEPGDGGWLLFEYLEGCQSLSERWAQVAEQPVLSDAQQAAFEGYIEDGGGLAALLPGGDPVTMLLMMLPILFLYEGSILLASLLLTLGAALAACIAPRLALAHLPRPALGTAERSAGTIQLTLRGRVVGDDEGGVLRTTDGDLRLTERDSGAGQLAGGHHPPGQRTEMRRMLGIGVEVLQPQHHRTPGCAHRYPPVAHHHAPGDDVHLDAAVADQPELLDLVALKRAEALHRNRHRRSLPQRQAGRTSH